MVRRARPDTDAGGRCAHPGAGGNATTHWGAAMSEMRDDVRGGGHGVPGRAACTTPFGEATPGRRDDYNPHAIAVRAYEATKEERARVRTEWTEATRQHHEARRAFESDPTPETFVRLRFSARRAALADLADREAGDFLHEIVEAKAATERRA